PIRRRNIGSVNGCDVLCPAVSHYQFQLALEDFEDAFNAGLSERAESPQERATNTDRPGSQSERLEYIRSPADASIQEHRDSAPDLFHNFWKSFDGRSARLRGPSSVIGHQNAIDTVLDRETCVLAGIDAFDQELQRCRLAQAVDNLPRHARILRADAGH